MPQNRRRTPLSHRARTRRLDLRGGPERLEPRLCLSVSPAPIARALAGDGVDALALGDVNGDRVADVAVASHHAGHTVVVIYSGSGQAAPTATGYAAKPLVTLTDPLGPGVGPLDIALGDFDGDGVSELAVSATAAAPRRGGSGATVATWKFTVAGNNPVNATVTTAPLTAPFTPTGYRGANGLEITSADVDGDGRDELLVGAATTSATGASVSAFGLTSNGRTWTVDRAFLGAPVPTGRGMALAAGDVSGDGVPDVVVASKRTGQVALFNGATGRWSSAVAPLRSRPGTTRLAVVSNENAPGAIVVTGMSPTNAQQAVLVPYAGGAPVAGLPVASPGAGALVPLGGGWVYQQSTLLGLDSSFPTSNGPVTPTVVFAATAGSSWVVQGYTPNLTPSRPDTYVEPLATSPTAAFTPLVPAKDAAPTGIRATAGVLTNLLAYPSIPYVSPYSIDLSGAPADIRAGLQPYDAITTTPQGPWGPDKVPNLPPNVPAGASNDWLRQRVLAAYMSAIGVDYQHHHDPRWLPAQGSPWNLVSTVGYQSQGVDCTNFTAWAYADALGVTINSDTQQQADIRPDNPNGTLIPASLADRVAIQTITHWTSYDDLVGQLMPGDILIINGNPDDPSQATHGITWLGAYGKDVTGKDQNLIIDATGISPDHIDSFGHVVPEGVHIRPFGAPGSLNAWYYNHVGHVLRLIKDDRTALAPLAGSTLPQFGGEEPGPLPKDQRVDALVVLRPRPESASLPSLESLAYQSLADRVYLSRSEFAARYGADPADVAAVAAWAKSKNLTVVSTDLGTRTVRIEGRAADMGVALGVRLDHGTSATGAPWSYKGELSVPVYLHDTIVGVFDVARAPDTPPDTTATPSTSPDEEPDYTPPALAAKYLFPAGDGAGKAVGVIELSGVIDDEVRRTFKTYFDSLGLPMPEIVSVGPAISAPSDEMALDIETIGAIVPGAKIVSYFGHNTPGDFLNAVQTAVHDDTHRLDVLSISYSFPERVLSPMYLNVASRAFLEAAVMGVTVFASAGDYGSSRGIGDGLTHVEFPSSSPWVTSTGGTRLDPSASIDTESVWNHYTIVDGYLVGDKGATGGGVSEFFAVPAYQADAGLDPRSVDPGHKAGRGGPDVASIADPSTGLWIYNNNRFFNDGGTSAAAPAWAALTVLLDAQLGKNVGFFNTLLYGPLRGKKGLHDVVLGNNISSHYDLEGKQIPSYLGYDATVGWDMTTGWGTPEGTDLLDELRKLLNPDG